MKHFIRQHVVNEYGLPVTKVESFNGELGSGIKDINGREIFEGDIILDEGDTSPVTFEDGSFWAFEQILEHFKNTGVEIVGHV